MSIEIRDSCDLPDDQVLAMYRAVGWSAADKPAALLAALRDSHALVTAWDGERLVGLANAISDGHLVVYYPHLIVDPPYQRRGIGTRLMRAILSKYAGFHQHMLVADGDAAEFYRTLGFTRAGRTEPLWIFDGDEH